MSHSRISSDLSTHIISKNQLKLITKSILHCNALINTSIIFCILSESSENMEQLLCIVEKDTLILPPTFSRLPPDGDEFPPNFSEPLTIIADLMNDKHKKPPPLPKSIPPKTAPRKIYRQDFVIEVSDKRGNIDKSTLNSMSNNTKLNNTKETIIQLDGDGGTNNSSGNTPKIIEDKTIRKSLSKPSSMIIQSVSTSNEPSSSSLNQQSSLMQNQQIPMTTDSMQSFATTTFLATMKNTTPRKTSHIAGNWRKDEKSEKSVRDKIAMFSNGEGNNNCQQTTSSTLSMSTMSLPSPSSLNTSTATTNNVANNNNYNSTVKKIPNITKSTENLIWNVKRQSEENLNISRATMRQKALSVENLDRPEETHDNTTTNQSPETRYMNSNFSTSDLTSGNLYNSLPRKTVGSGSHPALTRATSFTGYNTLNNSPYDDQRKTKINNLLERRKKSISKLRGLVIPEKTTITDENLEPTCLDLPEIKNKELERIKGNNLKNKIDMKNVKNSCSATPHWTAKQNSFSSSDNNPVSREYKQIFGSKRESPVLQTPPAKPPRNSLATPIKLVNEIPAPDSVSASTDSEDSDSVFSSKISSPPLSPEKYPLTRTLSSETNTSIASSNTSTLTSGSGSQASCSSMGSTPTVDLSRRVQKSDSINNRRNILVSARCRSGRDESSLLARQKSLNDDDSTDGGDDVDYNRTPKPKKRSMTNYKLASNDDLVEKNINIATYVEVVSENENITLPKDNPNSITDLSKWVRQEVNKVQPNQRSINTTVPKLSTAEIRKAFEAKTAATTPTTAPVVTPPILTQTQYPKEIDIHHDRISSWDSISSYSDIVTTTSAARKSRGSLLNVSQINSPIESHNQVEPIQSSLALSQEDINKFIVDACPALEKPEAFIVTLLRESPESSIGITLAGGSDYESKEVTIHRILKNSPADRDGQLQRGDRILAINNESMKDLTHGESVVVLKVSYCFDKMIYY